MDPYELFSTPPTENVMSSTPKRPKKPQPPIQLTTPPKENILQNRRTSSSTPRRTRRGVAETKEGVKKRRRKQQNVWDKYMKNNPELAQFVDEFNQSLEAATSKPLDITNDDQK